MKHHGIFDPNVDPIVPGGLTQVHKDELKKKGFLESKFTADDPNAVVGFRNPSLPGGVEMRKVTIPAGTEYLYHPTTGAQVLAECGNGFGLGSDARTKEDVIQVGSLQDGLGLYRFRYIGRQEEFVGVIAQEVERVRPDAVFAGSDGYLRVNYEMLGIDMVAWEDWQKTKTAEIASRKH